MKGLTKGRGQRLCPWTPIPSSGSVVLSGEFQVAREPPWALTLTLLPPTE